MKNIKLIIIFYIFVAVFAYALSLRASNLDRNDDLRNHNSSINLKIN